MNRALLASVFVAASLLLSCQDERGANTSAPSSSPIAFRFLAAGSDTLPRADFLAIRVWVDDSILVVDESFAWDAGEASLPVPLHRPLRFEVRAIRRRFDRDAVLWTASSRDTLDEPVGEQSIVTMTPTIADTATPDIRRANAGSGSALVILDAESGSLALSIPAGAASGSFSVPTSLAESLYVHGVPAESADGSWSVQLLQGDTATILLVGRNRVASRWSIVATTRDISPISLDLELDNAATRSSHGDTVVFTLPYVVDSTPRLSIALSVEADKPSALSIAGIGLDIAAFSWGKTFDVPEAGTPGTLVAIASSDSVGNPDTIQVRICRDTVAAAPQLAWKDRPSDLPWGTAIDTFVVAVIGGDSLLAPVFRTLAGPSGAISPSSLVHSNGDTAFWQGTTILTGMDTLVLEAVVSNRLGASWNSETATIRRHDPAGPDATPPNLSVAPPANAGWTNAASILLGGEASDSRSNPTTVSVVSATGTESVATWNATDGTWSFVLNLSADVDTTVSVHATDSAGNVSAPTVVRVRRDTKKPGFDWAAPPAATNDTLRTNQATMELRVSSSAADLRRVRAVRTSTTDTIVLTQESPGFWIATAQLPHGWSTWAVGAVDSAGNDSLRVLRVLRDTIPPAVSWAISGTNAEGKYAVSDDHDTIWLSADTTLTLALASTPGFAGVAVPLPTPDSAGIARAASSSLVLAQAAGTTTTWSFHATDALGNASASVKLVVVGLAPIASPTAKFGATTTPASTVDSLPWPQTVHVSCPTGTFLSAFGTRSKDTLVWTGTSLDLACQDSRIRSSISGFRWTLRDTAWTSLAIPVAPSSEQNIALLLDPSNQPYVCLYTGSHQRIYRYSPDSGSWTQTFSSNMIPASDTIRASAGRSSTGAPFFSRSLSGSSTFWIGVGDTRSGYTSQPSILSAIHGDSIHFAGTDNLGIPFLARTHLSGSGATDTIPAPSQGTLGVASATQSHTFAMIHRKGGTDMAWQLCPVYAGAISYTFGRSDYLSADFANPSAATRTQDDSLFVVGVDKAQSTLWARKYSSPFSTGLVKEQATLVSGVTTSNAIHSAWRNRDLWVNAAGKGLYRISSDIVVEKRWDLTSALSTPVVDDWDGAWILQRSGTTYRLVHFKSSLQ